jgi:hypothetical protein
MQQHARYPKLVLFALVAFLLPGCMGAGPYYVDERFTADEQERIREAAAMWQDATGGSAQFDLVFDQRVDIGEGERNAIVKVSAQAAFNRFPEMVSDTRVALFHEGSSFHPAIIVVIGERVENDMLRPTMAHEMGHSLGLRHVAEKEALMFADLHNDPNKCITEVDLREARRHVEVAADRPCGREQAEPDAAPTEGNE